MALISSGRYYPETKDGNVFIGSTAAAGVAFPISTGTAVTFGLWNTSPTKNAVLMKLDIGYTSGTIALGTIGIANQYVSFATYTGGPLTAATAGTAKNAFLGNGANSSMTFIPATATLTAGGTALQWLGKSSESATAGTGVFNANYDFSGDIIVAPGNIVFVCGSVAQTALFSMSLTWAEFPA